MPTTRVRLPRRLRPVLPVLLVGGLALGTGAPSQAATPVGPAAGSTSSSAAAFPAVDIEVLATGLKIPWDVAVLPNGSLLYDQRGGEVRLRGPNATGNGKLVRLDQSDLATGGEPGMLGLVLDPAFSSNRRFYSCQTFKGNANSARDVRVIRWRLAPDGNSAARVGAPVLTGLPLGNIHAGCRLRFGNDGKLYVGTGDAAIGTNPQDLNSLGGKVLRVNTDGTAPASNPWFSMGGNAAYVWNRGHRNVQGLAVSPTTGRLWTAEHGPDRDDEVNIVVKGANYGWDPVPDYNQSVPMTDLTKFPGAKVAAWSSGPTTRATSGVTFLKGSQWGAAEGSLLVALLKDQGVMVLTLSGERVVAQADIPELAGTIGRIRTVQSAPDGSVLITTSNGTNDRLLRMTPAG